SLVSLRVRNRRVVVTDVVAQPADRQREVGVLGQRVGRKAAEVVDDTLAPRAARPRDDGDRSQKIECSSLEVEGTDVLDRLKAGDPGAPVPHAHVARDGGDPRVQEVASELLDGPGSHGSVRVDRDDDSMASETERRVERANLSGLRPTMNADARIKAEVTSDEIGGSIRRSVVDDENFEIRVPVVHD